MAAVLEEFMTDVGTEAKEGQGAAASSEEGGEVEGGTTNPVGASLGELMGNGPYDLLMTGCHDFQAATGRDMKSLTETVCLSKSLDFEGDVLATYSGCTSLHLFIVTNGGLYGLGKNLSGQLGTGATVNVTDPALIPLAVEVGNIKKICTGKFHSLLLTKDGRVFGAGQNTCGQLGLGDNPSQKRDFPTFTQVEELSNVKDIGCGETHSVCCTEDGTLYTWGHPDSGVLGNGTDGRYIEKAGKISFHYICTPTPVVTFYKKDGKHKTIAEYKDIKVHSVAAGKQHTGCVQVAEDGGRVFTWGCGGYGRLGHATSQDELYPREVVPFSYSPVDQPESMCKQLEMGYNATCGINHEGSIFFWGMLPNSPRGEATMYPKYVPELIDVNAVDVTLGSSFVVMRTDQNEFFMWGKSQAGYLGFPGTGKTSSKPVKLQWLPGEFSEVGPMSAGFCHMAWCAKTSAAQREALPELPVLDVVIPKPIVRGGFKKGDKRKGSPSKKGDDPASKARAF